MVFKKSKLSKKIMISALSVFSLSLASLPFMCGNISSNNPQFVSSHTQAISDGSESQITSFSLKTQQQIGDDWGKYNATNISNDLIKSILIPNIDAQFYIQKNTQSADAVTQGYVTFYVYQKVTTYTNGVPSGSEEVELTPFAASGNMGSWADGGSDNYLWTTKNQTALQGFIKAEKYSFAWNSDENIADFLESNNLTASDLASQSNASEIIKTNFVSSSSVLPDGTTFTIENAPDITNAAQYGVAEVVVTFPADSNTATNWDNNTYPGGTTNTVTRVFRGFPTTSTSDSNQVEIVTQTASDIASASISSDSLTQLGLENYVLNPDSAKLSDLLPSQIASLSEPQLKQLFLNENDSNYISFTNKEPAVAMMYMGEDISNPNFASDTGLNQTYQNGTLTDVTKDMMISDIEINPNDLDGSMTLSYTYSIYDVFTNSILENQEGSIVFPANSFRNNPEAGQNLFFSFKTQDQLSFSSAQTVLNDYTNNESNTNYLKALSNSFINGSNYAYSRDRTLSITSPAANQISVTITYDNFNGNVYSNGNTNAYGLSQTQTYTFPSTAANVTWKSQAAVQSAISNYASLTPSDICTMISEGQISQDTFLDNSSNYSVLFIPDSTNGTLVVQATDSNGNSDTQFYVGLKASDSENTPVLDFSWISNNDISTSLLSIPVQNITVNDVIKYYLSQIPYFENQGLDASNVKLTPNSDGTLTVSVTLKNYNQSVPNITSSQQTFSTTLKGFVSYNVDNKNSYVAPLDLTVVLSVVFAVVISVVLIGVLVYVIIRRKKISKLSKKKFDK